MPLLRRFLATLWGGCLVAAAGCEEERVATLVAMQGCGLEQGRLNGLTIRARGDFPATPAAQLPVATPGDELRELPQDVVAITVEGKFGESVEAVGRTARLEAEGDLPVYFAPPDRRCPVSVEVPGRTVGALAVSPSGHALAVGGRSPSGLLVHNVVHLRDVEGVATELDEVLPVPSTGQTVHAVGERTFYMVGGGGTNRAALDSVVRIDLHDPPLHVSVEDPVPIETPGRIEQGRAFHASVRLLDERIAVVGGCSAVQDGACVASADTVTRTGFVMRTDTEQPTFEVIPDLLVPRYDHDLLRADDGALFVVGGRGVDGEGVRTVEVFLPMSGAWTPYGPSLLDVLDDREVITGATLLEGGMLVLVLDSGNVYWLDQNNLGTLQQWCSDDTDFCFTLPGAGVPTRRHPATLPGERVVIDNYVLPVALLGMTGADALNLSVPELGATETPPGPRIGSHAVMLDDGTLLQAGGVNPTSGVAQDPLFLRLRPQLDGPDEAIPDVAGLEPGALVVHDGGPQPHVSLSAGTLVFEPDPALPGDFLSTWVHVRGFRSQQFRLELTLEAIREARPRLVFSRGAVTRVVVQFDDQVRYTKTEPTGGGLTVTCDGEGIDFAGVAKSIRVDVAPDRIEIEGDHRVTCPGIDEGPVAVGLGAAGDGTIRATGLRLSRN